MKYYCCFCKKMHINQDDQISVDISKEPYINYHNYSVKKNSGYKSFICSDQYKKIQEEELRKYNQFNLFNDN